MSKVGREQQEEEEETTRFITFTLKILLGVCGICKTHPGLANVFNTLGGMTDGDNDL
jgi:hypothetical protein